MITQSELKELLNYNPETGVFTRLKSCSNVYKGDVAGSLSHYGYLRIMLKGKRYYSHRLAWLYVYGNFPSIDIDHINGVKHDNRIVNLRLACDYQNQQNQRHPRSNNKSGYLGVYEYNKSGKYRATIKTNGKRLHLGTYKTPDKAYEAYLKAKRELHEFCTI